MKRQNSSFSVMAGTLVVVVAGLGGASVWAQAADESLPVPHHLELANDTTMVKSVELASLRYAAFWNTGDEALARLALGDDFVDRTLPVGRAPGLEGALAASKNFRAAVPDLTAEIDDMTVVGDKALLHLHFQGHFTGKFRDIQGGRSEDRFSGVRFISRQGWKNC